jgi:hypothetical protein
MSRIQQPMVRALRKLMGPHEEAGRVGLRLRAWMMRYVPGQLTCMEFERFVHDYQEGSLSPRERRTFDLHMDLCPMCRVYFATYLRTIELGKRICAADDEATVENLQDDLVNAILAARSAR